MKGNAVRKLMQTYLRMQDVARIIRLGMSEPEGDGRGWAAVALTQLNKYVEAARLAAGPDGQTPCGYQTLRYVAHALAKVGSIEAAYHLSHLQRKCGRTKYITAGSREIQSIVESSALYLQSTAEHLPKLLAGHGARVSLEIDAMLRHKDDILALTPHRRYLMFTEAFNQLIRWYGRARLVPQALRACEIMSELGIPRNDMTIHFLSRGAAQHYSRVKGAARYSQAAPDWPGRRPEVVFLGRCNSGKSSMINSLFSSLTKFAPATKKRGTTRCLDFFEVNRERAGLPQFMLVDTPGLGTLDVKNAASITREWPDLIYQYLRTRQALKHVFHFCDARNKRLLPGDKQLIHLLAKAQRRSVRYTIVITKIDVCSREVANQTAKNIKEELAPFVDVDIMFASARSLRGVDHLWSKIWQSVTDSQRGRFHKDLGPKQLDYLRRNGSKAVQEARGEQSLSELLNIPDIREPKAEDFDSEDWAEDTEIQKPTATERKSRYFDDSWGQELNENEGERDSSVEGLQTVDFGEAESEEDQQDLFLQSQRDQVQGDGHIHDDGPVDDDFSDADLEQQWEAFQEEDEGADDHTQQLRV